MARFMTWFNNTFGVVSGVAVSVILFMTIFDVIMRKMAGQGVPGVVEIGEVLLVITVFMAMGVAQRSGDHISTSVLTSRLQPRTRKIVRVGAAMIGIVVVGFMVIITAQAAWISLSMGEYRFGIVQMPIWPARFAIFLGLVAFLIEYVRTTVRYAREQSGPASNDHAGDSPNVLVH